MEEYNAELDRLRTEDEEGNAYEIGQINQHFEFAQQSLDMYSRDRPGTEAAMNTEWDGHCDAIAQMLEPYQEGSEADPRRSVFLPAPVAEGVARVIETQRQIRGEQARQAETEGRRVEMKDLIRSTEEQLDLDAQLEQSDEQRIQVAEQEVSRFFGTLYAVEQQLELFGRNLSDLNMDHDAADADLCDALRAMLIARRLVEGEEPQAERSERLGLEEAGISEKAPHNDQESQSANLDKVLRKNKTQAKTKLATARRRFDQIRETYQFDPEEWARTRKPSDTQSNFDHRYLEARRYWTGRITAAEKDIEQAEQAMQAAALPPSDTAESGFVDLPDDGRYSCDASPIDRNRIEAWRWGVDQKSKAFTIPSREDWPDDVEYIPPRERNGNVEVGDSDSCCAEGRPADGIRDWNQQRKQSGEP